ncbi:uncharacterized protein J3R85_008313 [Psidium guajava]|nr:uncharacterized protein J3R85_008313 [Psidium guajava]
MIRPSLRRPTSLRRPQNHRPNRDAETVELHRDSCTKKKKIDLCRPPPTARDGFPLQILSCFGTIEKRVESMTEEKRTEEREDEVFVFWEERR